MATSRPLSADELVRNVQSKLQKAGLELPKYQRQLKDIAALFEPERSRVELITEGSRAGAWEMFCYFKGIRHCFHSAREIAATFGIPITRNGEAAVPAVPAPVPPKRKRDEEEMLMMAMPRAEPRMVDPAADDLYSKLIKSEPAPKGKKSKKTGRMGSRFQNQKLVKAINSHVGMEVVCGNLRARLVSANLGGMTFELLDECGRPCGDMVPPSQLAKRSCLAHQNNAWKSIKVDGITLDSWVTRLQEEIEGEDGGTDGALQAAMFMQRVDEMRQPTADDDDDYGSGNESDQQRSYSGGSPSKGLKLLSGAALQRPRHPGQQAESVQDMQVPRSAAARPMQDDVERFDALPADGGYQSVAEPRAEPSVQLVVNLVDPNGTTVESHMAMRLAQLEDLQVRTMDALRKTTDTLRQLLSEAERLGIALPR